MALHVSFGKHHSVADAEELEVELRSVGAHVFVQETTNLPASDRLALIGRVNLENARARKDRAFREQVLARAFAQGAAWERAYSREERRVVIDSKRLAFYTVEAYAPEELDEWQRTMRVTQDSAPLEAALARGDVDEALRLERDNLERFARVCVTAKNARVVDGFERMRSEIGALLPELLEKAPLRLLARYGRAHQRIADLLRERGFRVTSSGTSGPALYTDAVLIALSAGEPVPDDAIAAALFQSVHSTVFPDDLAKRYADWAASVRRRFERLGGAHAFVTLLREAAAETADLRALAARVGDVLRGLG